MKTALKHPAEDILKVAILFPLNLKGGRTVCRGVMDYARRHSNWRCMLLEGRDNEQLLNFRNLGISGIVTHTILHKDAKAIADLRIPVVISEPRPEMLAPDSPLANAPYVKMDSYGVGVLAANYYLGRGYKSFAYVGEPLGMYWSTERRNGFADTLAKAGFDCEIYDGFTAKERRSWDAERPRIINFLRSLPKPTAIFAAMDNRARLILYACADAGISVPNEIAVLGVDNDPILCESTIPTLSSIRTGGFRRGQKAAEMLDDLMHGRPVKQKNVVMEPISVVTRESTGYYAMRDPVIARALKFIHTEAPQRHIDVSDVVAAAGCSRRYLEMHFRQYVGVSVRDIIMQTKIDRVKFLLEQSNLSIGEITEQCGFARESHLAVLFKKATGFSMRNYRRQNREEPDE
jgi:LacI family transcriptional regulator